MVLHLLFSFTFALSLAVPDPEVVLVVILRHEYQKGIDQRIWFRSHDCGSHYSDAALHQFVHR